MTTPGFVTYAQSANCIYLYMYPQSGTPFWHGFLYTFVSSYSQFNFVLVREYDSIYLRFLIE